MKRKRELILKDAGELAVIRRLCRHLPRHSRVVTGVGDDCAVVRLETNAKNDLLLTSDAVIEGIHFTTGTVPPAIGHKAIGRVLSDIAAMGGRPEWALINLVAPPVTKIRTIDGIYAGATKLAGKYGLPIVGGDTSSGKTLELHVFAAGSVPRGKAVLRSGATPGDFIFVTGVLGGSRAGKHLSFTPRVAEGLALRNWASAMIDVSDGLATDLRHLTTMSGTGAWLDLDSIPVSSAASRLQDKISPVEHALYDGEDFELLFTIPSLKLVRFIKAWATRIEEDCHLIGLMTDKKGVIECMQNDGTVHRLKRTGYEHFTG